MSSSNKPVTENLKHSDPIPITARNRSRSLSVSSASSGSVSSASDLPTPNSSSIGSQRISIPSPSTSPILSYFLAQSPTTKTPVTATAFPFKRKFGTVPVFEADEDAEREIPSAVHARRASVTISNRFSQPPTAMPPDVLNDRGTSFLRRLSLSSNTFAKPQVNTNAPSASPPSPPPNTAVSPVAKNAPFVNKPRRSATISSDGGGRPRRAPSPMGERILKGHFDGFN